MDPRTYFVYGTLRPGGRYWSNIETLIADYEPGFVDGYQVYHLPDGYPAVQSGDGRVFGDVIFVRSGHEAQARKLLDEIEVCTGGTDALFRREMVRVHRLRAMKSKGVPADIYVWSHANLEERGELIDDGDWRQYSSQLDERRGAVD